MNASPCPRAGSGVHRWLVSEANRCRWRGLSPQTAAAVLRDGSAWCGRAVPSSELEAAVRTAFNSTWQPSRRPAVSGIAPRFTVPKPPPKWPTANLVEIERLARTVGGIADLWEACPVRIEDNLPHAEEILPRLFPPDSLLCCGESQSVFDTKPMAEWQGHFADLQFIVPSPMSAVEGLTKEGKPSKHALSNTGPRRFLVVECDFSIYARDGQTETEFAPLIRKLAADGIEVLDQCAALLLHLGQFAPLVCAVHSGGKSLHGWFYVAGQPEAKVHRFFRYAVVLGADSATWTPCQFVRMPDGTRDNGKRQTVFFFNPRPLEVR